MGAAVFALAGLGGASTAVAAQPGIGGPGGGPGGPGGVGGPPGGPGARKDKKEGPAEEAPKDKEALRPIAPVPAQPERQRRIMLFDLHGYMRMRGDYFHRMNLGLPATDFTSFEPLPGNKYFLPPVETLEGRDDMDALVANDASCIARLTDQGVSATRIGNRCQRRNGFASANLRLRMEPTLHVTDTVKVHSQIDLLDNVVLGSTPDTFAYGNPGMPLDLFTRTQVPPQALNNSTDDSVVVKRAWGHIKFGFGLDLRFGRMPQSWGMGVVANHGNGYARGEQADIIRHLDRDYGDSVDSVRLAYDLGKDRRRTHTLALSWDWAASGRTTGQMLGPAYDSGRLIGQAFSAEKFDNVYQWSASVERRDDMEMLQRKLSLGGPVVNYGLKTWLRFQDVDETFNEAESLDVLSLGGVALPVSESTYGERLVSRRALMATPDLWMRVNWRTLRVELEAAGNFGTFRLRDIDAAIEDPDTFYETRTAADLSRRIIANFGYALEFKYGFFKDRFHIGFDHGFASGDRGTPAFAPDVQAPVPALDDNNVVSNFRFNPAYNLDLLLFREQLGTVSNAAYFKPWAAFYFFKHFSARVDVGYALAAAKQSTLGNRFSYGIELDGGIRYHDAKEPIFFQLQYGVLFPLGAFNRINPAGSSIGTEDARASQTVQAQVGIRF
ncbi:MAG: TIGR04551 family protein [Myxococcota bacterium]